jgi:hypothetical protein
MGKVLIISYYAPPVGMAGAMRMTKLTKYLPRFNWQPYILTTKPIAYYHYDYELLNDLKNIPIFRSENLDIARILYLLKIPQSAVSMGIGKLSLLTNFLLFPDAKILWTPFAYRLGCKIIKDIKPEIIWTTATPFSTLLVARALKERFQIPLVLDFRDPWPTGFVIPPNPQRKRLINLRNQLVKSADLVIAVNKTTAEQINFPQAQIIENGFDPDDFLQPKINLSGFNIVYTGSVWENLKELQIVAEAVSNIKDVKIVLVGKCDADILNKIKKYGNVDYYGTRPHSETTAIMKGASLLLYLTKPNQIVGIKLYEYLGAGRPVLGVCNECNEAMRIIEHHSVGMTVSCNKDEIHDSVLMAMQNKFPYSPKDLERFNRVNQTRKLAELMNSLIR